MVSVSKEKGCDVGPLAELELDIGDKRPTALPDPHPMRAWTGRAFILLKMKIVRGKAAFGGPPHPSIRPQQMFLNHSSFRIKLGLRDCTHTFIASSF